MKKNLLNYGGPLIFSLCLHGLLLLSWVKQHEPRISIGQTSSLMKASLFSTMKISTVSRPRQPAQKTLLPIKSLNQKSINVFSEKTTITKEQFSQNNIAKSTTLNSEKRNKLLSLLHSAIAAVQTYPDEAEVLDQTGTVTLNFFLLPNGAVMGASVSKSSGVLSLDKAALSALKSIAPFKPAKMYLQAAQKFEIEIAFG